MYQQLNPEIGIHPYEPSNRNNNVLRSCHLIKQLAPQLKLLIFYKHYWVVDIELVNVCSNVFRIPGLTYRRKYPLVFVFKMCGFIYRNPFALCRAAVAMISQKYDVMIGNSKVKHDGWKLLKVMYNGKLVHIQQLFNRSVRTGETVFDPTVVDRLRDMCKTRNILERYQKDKVKSTRIIYSKDPLNHTKFFNLLHSLSNNKKVKVLGVKFQKNDPRPVLPNDIANLMRVIQDHNLLVHRHTFHTVEQYLSYLQLNRETVVNHCESYFTLIQYGDHPQAPVIEYPSTAQDGD